MNPISQEEVYKRKKRTPPQNNALHLYCELLAQALNDAGFDMKRTLKHDVEIPWNKDMVKEHIWKPVQESMTGKKSTTEMNTVDPSEIYEVVSRYLGQRTGVYVPWPSNEYSTRQVR